MENQELSVNHLLKLKAAKNFYENSQPITSADFDGSGEFCVTASLDDSINLYNCLQGRHKKLLLSKKYGIHLTRFTHLNTNIIYASNNGTVRYLSLHVNKFIRYFEGHQNRVVSLEMSPSNDLFISGSINEGIKLWDLKQPGDIGFVNVQAGRPCVSFDPTGVVFAVGFQGLDNSIRLYDVRQYDKEPFATFKIIDNYMTPSAHPRIPVLPEWTSIKFSNDGEKILITTSGDVHYVIDAYDGELKRRLVGHVGSNNASSFLGGEETDFTPDGRYVIAGSQDGQINFWDTSAPLSMSTMFLDGIDTRPIHTLEHHVRPTQVVKFNPTRIMMISACSDLAFWLPALDNEESENNSDQETYIDNSSQINKVLNATITYPSSSSNEHHKQDEVISSVPSTREVVDETSTIASVPSDFTGDLIKKEETPTVASHHMTIEDNTLSSLNANNSNDSNDSNNSNNLNNTNDKVNNANDVNDNDNDNDNGNNNENDNTNDSANDNTNDNANDNANANSDANNNTNDNTNDNGNDINDANNANNINDTGEVQGEVNSENKKEITSVLIRDM
ncbi:hypothetical protein Glove_69g63 [Diversispora epigaea]|uniref:Anaphase-promoting complex subunit 4 WD40 domain-containing protein n=1 Tax=Diversispora epigaea TaxID=1348612 RepID=A0A397JJS4_9GLOM|nr:hypothetical protein Glove_69g63 [Diversispora epigaea]